MKATSSRRRGTFHFFAALVPMGGPLGGGGADSYGTDTEGQGTGSYGAGRGGEG